MAQNGVDDRPLEKLVEKEAAISREMSEDSGRTEEAISSLRDQMDDLRNSIAAIASTLASRAEEARDTVVETGRATLDHVTETARSTADTVASSAKSTADTVATGAREAGHTALDQATGAADMVTQGKERAKEIPGFETMQTIATLAPIAATVARRIPGGKKMVVAGAAAYGAYLLLDAVGNARDAKSKKA